MSDNEQLETSETIAQEFQKKFGSHPVRVERFAVAQRSQINKLSSKLKETYPEKEAEFSALVYAYMQSEDLYPEPIETFIEDFMIITEEFGFPIASSSKEDIIKNALTPFIKTMKFQSTVFSELSAYLIQRVSQDWDSNLIQSYILNDFFKPLISTLVDQFPKVKIKFLTAFAWLTLRRFTSKTIDDSINNTIKDVFEIVKKEYPDLEGKTFAYDLAYKFLLLKNFDNLMKLIEPEVVKLRKQLEIDRENMQMEQAATKRAQKSQAQANPVDGAKGKLSMKLYEIFHFNQDLSFDKEQAIIKALSLLLRRMALQIWGHVSAESLEPLKSQVVEFLWSEIKDYPEIIINSIAYKATKFYEPNLPTLEDIQEAFKADKEGEIEKYKEKFIELLFKGFTGGADYEQIAQNLILLLKKTKEIAQSIGSRFH